MSDRLTIRGWLYVRGYRGLMKIAHRFNWHHTDVLGLRNDAGWPLHRCSWCGLSSFVMPKLRPGEAGMPIGAGKQVRSEPASGANT